MSGVARGLAVLEQLTLSEHSPSHTNLAQATQLPKSTLSNVLAELVALGYIVPVNKGYALGGGLAALGYRIMRQLHLPPELPDGMHALLERLAHATGETAVFTVEIGASPGLAGEVLALDHAESPHEVRYVPGLGQPQPVAHTASGYALLAFSGRDAAAIPPDTLVRRTPETLIEPSEINAELERVRRRGYARNVSLGTTGVTSIAIPWPATSTTVNATISIVGPSERVRAGEDHIVRTLRDLRP